MKVSFIGYGNMAEALGSRWAGKHDVFVGGRDATRLPGCADALKDTVAALASRLAQGPTRAHGGVKRLLLMATQDGLESQMERETRQIVELSQSKDGLEGVRAFVERHKPVFVGQ